MRKQGLVSGILLALVLAATPIVSSASEMTVGGSQGEESVGENGSRGGTAK